MKRLLLASALLLAGPALAQQAPATAPGTPEGFRTTLLLETPLRGTPQRTYRLYTIELAPGAATPRHMHPGDEIALVTDGTVTLEMEGEAPKTFHAGEVLHPRPMTAHMARNASATAVARLTVSSITESGRPSTVMAGPRN
jgi:quercetin dioxygenase-like cupin family protein